MIVPAGIFAALVYVALAVVVVAPLILVVLWFRDRRKGDLW
jgi:hypothetical protein